MNLVEYWYPNCDLWQNGQSKITTTLEVADPKLLSLGFCTYENYLVHAGLCLRPFPSRHNFVDFPHCLHKEKSDFSSDNLCGRIVLSINCTTQLSSYWVYKGKPKKCLAHDVTTCNVWTWSESWMCKTPLQRYISILEFFSQRRSSSHDSTCESKAIEYQTNMWRG
jgi:hypothetical protein